MYPSACLGDSRPGWADIYCNGCSHLELKLDAGKGLFGTEGEVSQLCQNIIQDLLAEDSSRKYPFIRDHLESHLVFKPKWCLLDMSFTLRLGVQKALPHSRIARCKEHIFAQMGAADFLRKLHNRDLHLKEIIRLWFCLFQSQFLPQYAAQHQRTVDHIRNVIGEPDVAAWFETSLGPDSNCKGNFTLGSFKSLVILSAIIFWRDTGVSSKVATRENH